MTLPINIMGKWHTKKTIDIAVIGHFQLEIIRPLVQTLNTQTWIPDTNPIIKNNGVTIRNEDLLFMFHNLQQKGGLPSWRSPKGFIFVIDLNDQLLLHENPGRLWVVRTLLYPRDPRKIANILLAIFENKANNHVDSTDEDLIDAINMWKNLVFSIFNINVETGEGISEGINWLIEAIVENQVDNE